MGVDRPTFHEAWYRIADLRPRLLSGVSIRRQYFRSQLWYVLENPANSEYARIAESAYRFVGALDGRKTVAQLWRLCNEQLGDSAPTQAEVIQLLGQLHAMNLLYVDLPPDAEGLLNRYRRRVRRQVLSHLANVLFLRIPVIDPDAFLDRWVGVVGPIFSWTGFCLWAVLLAAGSYFILVNAGELFAQSSDVLAPSNLFLLYLSFVLVKICHEFSHAFACKRFGRLNRSTGEVHSMGVMFLVLFPLPYVDASSAWAFRNKWHRAIVGLAGVMAELAAASSAAIVWTQTSTGTVHIIAYNVILVAGVSTVLFNGNPLLRFDAYYVLCDLLEIPNLAQRSRSYLYYLVKRYLWAVKRTQSPAYSPGEISWFLVYGTTSTVYRLYISIRILLFLNRRLPEQLFILVPLFAIAAISGWLIAPLVQFIRYLAVSPELARSRRRAVVSTAGGLCVTIVVTGLIRMPDHYRIEGIVEPARLALIHIETDGLITDFLPSQSIASPDGPPLVQAVNPELTAGEAVLRAERRALEARHRLAESQEAAAAQIIAEQIGALDESLERVRSQLDDLNLKPPFKGIWLAPEIDHTKGTYLKRGEQIGFVGTLDSLTLRVTAGQNVAAMIFEHAEKTVQVRVKGRPDKTFAGRIERVFPAGADELPSEALGYPAGGDTPTRSGMPQGRTAAEKFFEIRITPTGSDASALLGGQRVVARLTMPRKPLLVQWWQSARRLFQRRFHV